MTSQAPQLLVSVRSPAEVQAAIAGGCDWLDIKEPSRGSLGAADFETIAAICESIEKSARRPPISVALGELNDWSHPASPPALPGAVCFVKLGLSGCGSSRKWTSRWRSI